MYRKANNNNATSNLDFLVIDFLAIYISYFSACFFRLGFGFEQLDFVYKDSIIFISLVQLIYTFVSFKPRSEVLKRGYYIEFIRVGIHVAIASGSLSFYLLLTQKAATYSRLVFLYFILFYFVLDYILRMVYKKHLKTVNYTIFSKSYLIVTTAERLQEFIVELSNYKRDNFNRIKLVVLDADDSLVGTKDHDLTIVANINNVIDYAVEAWIDEVIIDIPENIAFPKDLFKKFNDMGLTVHIKLNYNIDLYQENSCFETLNGVPVITTTMKFTSLPSLILKRIMDIVGGLIGCLLTLILTIFIGPLMMISSPGPLFFSQVRVGQNGKKFKIYKFRSMYIDAEKRKQELMTKNKIKDGLMFKMDEDPRIIGSNFDKNGKYKKGVGNFIRDYSIDEFPQFFNVLMGDMSMVGTRPPTIDEWKKYDLHHRARMATKPGITGMWQVSGRSKITDFEDVIKLDKKYISSWSILLDIKIILKTIKIVLTKDGSA